MKSLRGWVGVAKVLSGVAAVLLLLVVVGALVAGIPQNAAGMAAKGICSAALVAGRPMTTLLADDVLPASPVLRLISIEVDSARQSVTGRFAGLFARTAVRLPDRGCVLGLPAAPVPAPPPPVASEAPGPAATRRSQSSNGATRPPPIA